jgi:hypothetical protein
VGAVVVLMAVLAVTACGGGDETTGEDPARSQDSPRFTPTGCPIDDTDFCDRAAIAANALVEGDVARLVELSAVDRFPCDEVPAELFPDCAPGRTLEGHAFFTGDFQVRVLSPAHYRERLASLSERVDPSYSDAHGGGELRILGIGTCGPSDPENRSYHVGATAALRDPAGKTTERWFESLEFVFRDGEWRLGMYYADAVRAWKKEFSDPLTQMACGNMRLWKPG